MPRKFKIDTLERRSLESETTFKERIEVVCHAYSRDYDVVSVQFLTTSTGLLRQALITLQLKEGE